MWFAGYNFGTPTHVSAVEGLSGYPRSLKWFAGYIFGTSTHVSEVKGLSG